MPPKVEDPAPSLRILCVFGRYQYGDPTRGDSVEFTSFIPSLERLGHRVELFDSWDRTCPDGYAGLNRRLLAAVEDFRPDLLLLVPMSCEVWYETVRRIRAMGVVTVCWNADDSWKFREYSRFMASEFTVAVTTYPQFLEEYRRSGQENPFFSQWAAPESFLREPTPSCQCRYDVIFVGAAHGSRAERIEALRRMGVSVRCFGHGWPDGPVAAEKMAELFNSSRISLNFANSSGENQLKARVFEVAGAGGFLLTERAPYLNRYYRDDEVAAFDTVQEAADLIRFYLDRPSLRDSMAHAAFERTRGAHCYHHRLAELLRFARTLGPAPPLFEYPRVTFEAAAEQHRLGPLLTALRSTLVAACSLVWGNERGRRAARRIAYELSWRVAGKRTYSAAGFPGRMFYGV